MKSTDVSRRGFGLLAGGLGIGRVPLCAASRPTAQQVVNQIREHLRGDSHDTSLDGFKAGDPAIEVRGIATTAMATFDVLGQASKAGLNLAITHEPTFYGARDGAPPPSTPAGRGRGPAGVAADDPVFKAKKVY